jgi:hypothetical protein
MLGHVMVAYDGSEGARHALTFARRCVAPDGRITLVRAVELPVPYVVGGFDGVVTLGELPTTEELERERTRLLASVADLGERATVRVELGHPVEVITRLAEDLAPRRGRRGARAGSGRSPGSWWVRCPTGSCTTAAARSSSCAERGGRTAPPRCAESPGQKQPDQVPKPPERFDIRPEKQVGITPGTPLYTVFGKVSYRMFSSHRASSTHHVPV